MEKMRDERGVSSRDLKVLAVSEDLGHNQSSSGGGEGSLNVASGGTSSNPNVQSNININSNSDTSSKPNLTSSRNPTDASSRSSSAAASASTSAAVFFERAFSEENKRTAKKFFSAYAQTWIGMSPIWLMGEAIVPGRKVGEQFGRGRERLVDASKEVVITMRELQGIMGTGAGGGAVGDVIVVIDEKLREGGEGSRLLVGKTAEVIKAAGEGARLVVTASFEKLSTQLTGTTEKGKLRANELREFAQSAEFKRSVRKHGRDALVLLDGALKHPVVVTGVTKFARSRGIPHTDALLRLASLGLARILRAIPEEMVSGEDGEEGKVEEIDAEELERSCSKGEQEEAENLGRVADGIAQPRVEAEAAGNNPKHHPGCIKSSTSASPLCHPPQSSYKLFCYLQ